MTYLKALLQLVKAPTLNPKVPTSDSPSSSSLGPYPKPETLTPLSYKTNPAILTIFFHGSKGGVDSKP